MHNQQNWYLYNILDRFRYCQKCWYWPDTDTDTRNRCSPIYRFYNKSFKNIFCFTECDFDFEQYEVRIPAYSMTGHLDIPIEDDAVFELDETFYLTIENGSLPQLISAGIPRIATVTILDNEEGNE